VLEFAVGLAEGAEIGVLVIIASWERQVACGRQVLVLFKSLRWHKLSSHKAASSVDGSALPVQEQNIVAREEEHDIAVGFRNDHDV
jgi:hypothetical protein